MTQISTGDECNVGTRRDQRAHAGRAGEDGGRERTGGKRASDKRNKRTRVRHRHLSVCVQHIVAFLLDNIKL